MPIVSLFFGIAIRMFYLEHDPPHCHAEHQGQRASFDFSGRLIAGHLQSRTALRLIREWASLHQSELMANWARIKSGKPLESIPPLE